MAELSDSTNAAQAFSYMPIAWSAGATFGPLIGGQLANPAERFPGLFGDVGLLRHYPYVMVMAFPALAALGVAAWTYRYVKEVCIPPLIPSSPLTVIVQTAHSHSKTPYEKS